MEGKESAKERAKARKREHGKPGAKNLTLSGQARELLGVEKVMSGRSEGEIVSSLICTHLRCWVVSYRVPSGNPEPAADLGDRASAAEATLPINEPLTPPEGETKAEASGEGSGRTRGKRKAG